MCKGGGMTVSQWSRQIKYNELHFWAGYNSRASNFSVFVRCLQRGSFFSLFVLGNDGEKFYYLYNMFPTLIPVSVNLLECIVVAEESEQYFNNNKKPSGRKRRLG